MVKMSRIIRNFCLGTPDRYFEGVGRNPKILTFSVFKLKSPSIGQVIPKLISRLALTLGIWFVAENQKFFGFEKLLPEKNF